LCCRAAVAQNEEGIIRLAALESACTELCQHKSANIESEARPQRLIIGLKYRPLNTVVDAHAQEDRYASHRNIAPRSVAADRTRSPNNQAASRHGANHIYQNRIELILFNVTHCYKWCQGTSDSSLGAGRRLEHAPRIVST